MKKILIFFCAVFVLLTVSACNSGSDVIIPLTDDEKELLVAFGSDLQIITEEDYPDTVTEIIYHPDIYFGKVFQIEGIYDSNLKNDSIPYVYRYLSNDGVKSVCGLPLMYMSKEIPDNTWIRVTGIINTDTLNDATVTVLDVVAVETMSEPGNETLEWEGSHHHHH